MSIVSKYTLNFTDGEYLNYIFSCHSFVENKKLENFFKKIEDVASDPYDEYVYELHLVKKLKEKKEK